MNFKKWDANKIVYAGINLLIFVIMFYLTAHTPLYSDDIPHATIDGVQPITTIADIFTSTKIYYDTWGGRVISRLIFQYLIVFNKPLYNILNAAVFVAYANMIQLFIKYSVQIKRSNFSLLLTYLILWLFTPSFGGSYLWLTGSVTYLWLMVPILGFVFYYYKRWMRVYCKYEAPLHKEYGVTGQIVGAITLFLLGIIAGWSIEAAACAVLFGLMLFVVYMLKTRNKITITEWIGMIGFVIGLGLLMLAPGNFIRADTVTESSNLIVRYVFRIARETYYSLQYMLIPFGMAVILFILSNLRNRKEKDITWKNAVYSHENMPIVLLLVLSIVSIYVMTFSSVFANRIFITPLAFNIIALNILLLQLLGYESEPCITDDKQMTKVIYGRQILACGAIAVLALYCAVQLATAVLVCSRNNVPIEKYITYQASDVENGVW